MLGAVVGVAAIVASGVIADRFGRAHAAHASPPAAIAAFSGFAPQLLNGGDVGEIVFMMLGFMLLGLSFGQCLGRDGLEFPHHLPLHRLGADLGSRVAVRRRIRALGRAASGEPFRADGRRAYLLSGAICTLVALSLSARLGTSGDEDGGSAV